MVIVVVAADYGVKARADWPLWDTNMAMPKSSNDFATEQLLRNASDSYQKMETMNSGQAVRIRGW
jgi:hypothetical protein